MMFMLELPSPSDMLNAAWSKRGTTSYLLNVPMFHRGWDPLLFAGKMEISYKFIYMDTELNHATFSFSPLSNCQESGFAANALQGTRACRNSWCSRANPAGLVGGRGATFSRSTEPCVDRRQGLCGLGRLHAQTHQETKITKWRGILYALQHTCVNGEHIHPHNARQLNADTWEMPTMRMWDLSRRSRISRFWK